MTHKLISMTRLAGLAELLLPIQNASTDAALTKEVVVIGPSVIAEDQHSRDPKKVPDSGTFFPLFKQGTFVRVALA